MFALSACAEPTNATEREGLALELVKVKLDGKNNALSTAPLSANERVRVSDATAGSADNDTCSAPGT